jgi:phospholipid/cholesterol/gamma-HCH transport system substrate-binding protein
VKATMQELGPEIPRATRRAMEALDETVVTLKALQKSFILKGSAKEVRDEEAERERARLPAGKPDVKPEAK